ncbi:MAG: hypothetical protein AAGC55_18075, partial [Myxococcota bacterium]
YLVAQPGAGLLMTSFFVAIPLLFSILFSLVWLLGAELYEDADKATVARAYSRLGAASITGGMAGGALARAVGPLTGPTALVLIGAVMLVVTALCVVVAHRAFPLRALGDADKEAHAEQEAATMGAALTTAPAGLLLAIAMTAAMAAIFIDFQFYLSATRTTDSSEELTVFFANVYLILNLASLVLQLLITPRLQGWFGLSGSLMVLPLVLFGGAATAMISASAVARAGLRIAEGGIKSGVHRSLWEQAFLLFPRSLRSMIKVLIDGLGARIAEGLAALLLYIWLVQFVAGRDLNQVDTRWVAVALILSTALWLALTQLLRRRLCDRRQIAETPAWQAPLPDF